MITCKVGNDCGCGFKNTGANYSEVWNDIHKLLDKKVDCEECNLHGHDEVNGLRDHVGVGIGKKPHNLELYKRWVKEVNCVWDKCIKNGICKES